MDTSRRFGSRAEVTTSPAMMAVPDVASIALFRAGLAGLAGWPA